MKKCKLLLFDLDGTLLQSEKTISTRTLSALKKCRENDILIGVSTSRSEQNSLVFLNELMPDILISSGDTIINVAVIGKPNAGKSSLVNKDRKSTRLNSSH